MMFESARFSFVPQLVAFRSEKVKGPEKEIGPMIARAKAEELGFVRQGLRIPRTRFLSDCSW